MNLRHWIPAVFNLSFPGVGYFLVDKKIFGSLLLLFTVPYQAWYYISHISETYVVPGITYIYLLFGLVSAIHVYRLAKKKYHITEEKKNLTKNAFKRQLFIGLFLFLLFIGYAFLYSNIQTFFGFSKTGPGDAITVLKPIEYKILLFAFDVISSLSCLVIPILSYYLQLKKDQLKEFFFHL